RKPNDPPGDVERLQRLARVAFVALAGLVVLEIAQPAQQIGELLGRARSSPRRDVLQAPFELRDRLGLDELRDLVGREQRRDVSSSHERPRAPLEARRIPFVEEGHRERELELGRERGRRGPLKRDYADLAPLDVRQELDEAANVERLLERLTARLAGDRE